MLLKLCKDSVLIDAVQREKGNFKRGERENKEKGINMQTGLKEM